MKRYFATAIATSTALTLPLVWIYFAWTPFALNNIFVTHQASCNDLEDIQTHSSSEWVQEKLVISISELQTCGLAQQSVAVQRIFGRLFVRTTYASPSGEVAACYCRQNFDLTLKDAPKQPYKVTVYNLP